MDDQLRQALIRDTEELRSLLREFSTETVVGMCASRLLSWFSAAVEESPLVSPTKQVFFLLGLLLTTSKPSQPREFGELEWGRSVELLNSIFYAYVWMFWPSPEELPKLSEAWYDVRRVAMPAFLHYFNTASSASVEQVSDWVERYLARYDEKLRQEIGISATEALDVTQWITRTLDQQLADLQEAAEEESGARIELLDRAQTQRWDLTRLRIEAQYKNYYSRFERMVQAIQRFLKVELSALRVRFGDQVAESYWNAFVSRRGEAQDFTYMTDCNVAEQKPLFEVDTGVALCPTVNALYAAVLTAGEQLILEGPLRDSFLRSRDRAFEEEVENEFRRLFGDSAEYYPQTYETPALQYEHDLIILWNGKLFVVEAKASPPIEPFRDPEKAFTRIKRAFHSDKGIQKAFDQANRIRRQLSSGASVNLYDGNREPVATLAPEEIETVHSVCITRDDFGPLAVDLSLLLEKDTTTPYPWAINVLDLKYLVDAWDYFGWGPKRLCEYLDSRLKLHGRIISFDELEIAGFYLQHGGLKSLLEMGETLVYLPPDYSDVFDNVYRAKRGGPEVKYNPIEATFVSLRERLMEAVRNSAS